MTETTDIVPYQGKQEATCNAPLFIRSDAVIRNISSWFFFNPKVTCGSCIEMFDREQTPADSCLANMNTHE